jgi:hypothetical protein
MDVSIARTNETKRSPRRRGRRIGHLFPPAPIAVLLLLVSLALASPPTAQATGPLGDDTAVTVSADALQRDVFVVSQVDLRSSDGLEKAAAETLALEAMIQAGASPADAEAAMIEIKQKLAQQASASPALFQPPDLSQSGSLAGGFAPLEDNPLVAKPGLIGWYESIDAIAQTIPVVSTIWVTGREIYKHAMTEYLYKEPNAADPLSAGADDYNIAIPPLVLDVFADAYNKARMDPDLGQAWTNSIGVDTNSDIGASVRITVSGDPVLARQTDVWALQDQTGKLSTDLGTLRSMVVSRFSELNQVIAEADAHLVAIDQDQHDLLAYAADAATARLKAEAEKTAAEARQTRVDGARAGVYLLSQIVGTVDPKAAKQISGVGGASIDVATALSKWATATSGLGLSDSIFNLQTVIASGSIVSAVSKLVGTFSGVQTPEEAILTQVALLRQEVAQMRTEMHGRFDRVDSELQTIYDTMLNRFDRVDAEFGQIDANVHDTQVDLLQLRSDLDRFEGNMFSLVGDLSRETLNSWVDFALGYREHYGHGMGQDDFEHAESYFFVYGTQDAFNLVHAAPSGPPYDDAAVLRQLNSYPLEANLNYLSEVTRSRWGEPLLDQPAPNPRDWAIAARAYSRLMSEWPGYAQYIDSSRATQIAGVGQVLEDGLSQIAVKTTPDGGVLLDKLFTNYGDAIVYLNDQLSKNELRYRKNTTNGVDRLGGTGQTITSTMETAAEKAIPSSIPNVNGGNSVSWNPAEMADMTGPYKLVAILNPSAVNARWNAVRLSSVVSETAPAVRVSSLVSGKAPARAPAPPAHVQVTVMYRIGSTVVGQRQITVTTAGSNLNGGVIPWAVNNWATLVNLKSKLEPVADTIISAGQTLAVSTASTLLNIEHGQMYASVANDLRDDAVSAPEDDTNGHVQSAILGVRAAKALLESVLGLGLPRSLPRDDLMQALLYGSIQLPGETLPQDLQARYSAASGGPVSPRGAFEQETLGHRDYLQTRVAFYQQLISGGLLTDTMPMLETATERARFADTGGVVDTFCPTTAATGLASSAASGWLNHSQSASLAASDTGGSGLAATFYTLDGVKNTYTGPFGVSGEGSHTIVYWSTDYADNTEIPQTGYVNIDTTPPATTDNSDGLPHSSFTLMLTPTDGASGVVLTEYRIDGHAWKEGTVVSLRLAVHRKPASLTRGAHLVEYRSTDSAGNVESIRGCTVTIQ